MKTLETYNKLEVLSQPLINSISNDAIILGAAIAGFSLVTLTLIAPLLLNSLEFGRKVIIPTFFTIFIGTTIIGAVITYNASAEFNLEMDKITTITKETNLKINSIVEDKYDVNLIQKNYFSIADLRTMIAPVNESTYVETKDGEQLKVMLETDMKVNDVILRLPAESSIGKELPRSSEPSSN